MDKNAGFSDKDKKKFDLLLRAGLSQQARRMLSAAADPQPATTPAPLQPSKKASRRRDKEQCRPCLTPFLRLAEPPAEDKKTNGK
jgi:hypothetical protein